jgi:putative endonuclease
MEEPSSTGDANYRVYVLINGDGRRYIGVSEDVSKRLAQHNSGISQWTSRRGPWRLEWTSGSLPLGDALRLEKLMKRQKGGDGLRILLRDRGSSGS